MVLDFSQNNLFILFEITDTNNVTLKHFSAGAPAESTKNLNWCSISDIHICGENPKDHHGAKHTGTYGSSALKYQKHNYYQNKYGNKLEFFLSDTKIQAVMHYQFYHGIPAIRSWTTVTNISHEAIGLEYVSSFSYTGLKEKNLKILLPHNSWVREVNWKEYTPDMLGLDRYTASSTKRISVSNTGTWSSKEYLPMAAAVSENEALFWQIENNGAWQWEISDIADMLYLKLSGPTEQENAWYKELAPGESFESVKACISAGNSFDAALCAMTKYRRIIFENNTCNSRLPVIFNDYMHCLWADPTEEKMIPVIDKAAAAGCEYYCMDAGWYSAGTWWETVGEWQPQETRFPNGIKKVFDYIRKKGMIPGIWLEIEVMGINCPILAQFDDSCFFMRHGKRVIDNGRYQLDFRNKQVRSFASAVIDRVVNEYGAGYIKFDYNIDAGSGTELNADSFGDGLLEHNRSYLKWIDEIKKKYPDLILENCSSGGMRMDYAMLSHHHIQSVTDQEDFINTAYIAAAAPTAVLPEQSAIWSYPLAANQQNEIVFNMTNAMLERLHLGGQITQLCENSFNLVQEGIACYKQIRNDLPNAIPFYPLGIPKHGDSIICLALRCSECTRIAVWCFDSDYRNIHIPLDCKSTKILYPADSKTTVLKTNGGIAVNFSSAYTAAIIEIF